MSITDGSLDADNIINFYVMQVLVYTVSVEYNINDQ